MSTNVVNSVAYLRTSRAFPEDLHQLCVEVNKSYVDIANAVNNRIISIFPTNRPALTGESWFVLNNRRQQTFRQVYTFTAAGNIDHGIDISQISYFTAIYGTIYNGTNWYPLPYVDVTAANNQINVVITSAQIQINAGAGSPPTIQSGIIVLEWMSQP